MGQRRKYPEIKPGERIQAVPQRGEGVLGLTNLLPDRTEHGPDAGRLGACGFQQALEAPWLTKIGEQLVDSLLGRELIRCPAVAKEIQKGGIGL